MHQLDKKRLGKKNLCIYVTTDWLYTSSFNLLTSWPTASEEWLCSFDLNYLSLEGTDLWKEGQLYTLHPSPQRFLSALSCCVRPTRKNIGFAHCDVRNHMSHDAMDDGFSLPFLRKHKHSSYLSRGEFCNVMELSIWKRKIRFHLGNRSQFLELN